MFSAAKSSGSQLPLTTAPENLEPLGSVYNAAMQLCSYTHEHTHIHTQIGRDRERESYIQIFSSG